MSRSAIPLAASANADLLMHAGPRCCEQPLLQPTCAFPPAVSSRDQAAQTSDTFSYPKHQPFRELHRPTPPASCGQAAQTPGSFSTSYQQASEGLTGLTTVHQPVLGDSGQLPPARVAQRRPTCLQDHFIPGQQVAEADRALPGEAYPDQLSVNPKTNSFECSSSCQGQPAADSVITQVVRSSQVPGEDHICGGPLLGIFDSREAAGQSCGNLQSEATEGHRSADSVLGDWHLPKSPRAAQSSTNSDSSSGTDTAAEAGWQVLQEMAEQAMPAVNVSLQDWNFRGLQSEHPITSSQHEQVYCQILLDFGPHFPSSSEVHPKLRQSVLRMLTTAEICSACPSTSPSRFRILRSSLGIPNANKVSVEAGPVCQYSTVPHRLRLHAIQ